MNVLTAKLGPLPRWAWAVMVLGAGFLYMRHRSAQAASQAASDQQAADQYNADAGAYSQYPDAYGGTYPLGGGGAAFDPYAFGGFGGSQQSQQQAPTTTTDPNAGAGDPVPPAQGNAPTNVTITVNGSSQGSTSGTSHGGHHKKTTHHRHEHHEKSHQQQKHFTGGGMPDRHPGIHHRKPPKGHHKTTHHPRIPEGDLHSDRGPGGLPHEHHKKAHR